jgi:hypothetical protein
VRPRCRAVPKPRHNMINGGNRTPGGLTGPSPGRKLGLLCGRAEPAPPGGGTSTAWMAVRGKVGDYAEGVFSEGRGLRVRIARHHEWRGPSLPPEVRREAGGLIGIHGEGVRPSSRACRARPSAGGLAQHGWPCGERSEMTPRGGFLGGTHSVRPRCEAVPIPGHNMINGGNRTPGGLTGPSPGRKLGLLYGRAEPAPPRGTSPAWMAVRGKVGDDAEGVFSEGRGLRARIARPYPNRGTT